MQFQFRSKKTATYNLSSTVKRNKREKKKNLETLYIRDLYRIHDFNWNLFVMKIEITIVAWWLKGELNHFVRLIKIRTLSILLSKYKIDFAIPPENKIDYIKVSWDWRSQIQGHKVSMENEKFLNKIEIDTKKFWGIGFFLGKKSSDVMWFWLATGNIFLLSDWSGSIVDKVQYSHLTQGLPSSCSVWFTKIQSENVQKPTLYISSTHSTHKTHLHRH